MQARRRVRVGIGMTSCSEDIRRESLDATEQLSWAWPC